MFSLMFSCWIQAAIFFYRCKILLKPQNVIVEYTNQNMKWKFVVRIFWSIDNLSHYSSIPDLAILNLSKDIKFCYFAIVHMRFNLLCVGFLTLPLAFTKIKNNASDSIFCLFISALFILGVKIKIYIT